MKQFNIRASGLAIALVICAAANAFDTSLSSESVRDAYFLGQRNDEKTAAFLSKYVQRLPLPKSGPHVSEIEMSTPYAQIVLESKTRSMGYSGQQAELNYHREGDTIRVRVFLLFTATYPLQAAFPTSQKAVGPSGTELRAEDFWRDFTFHFTQHREGELKTIEPIDVWSEPYYSRNSEGGSALGGAQVFLLFDAADVASAPARIEVIAPDGQHVTAEFDLATLK